MSHKAELWKTLRAAYAEAWRNRGLAGNDAEVLLDALREHGLGDRAEDENALRPVLIDAWDRGVPPYRLRLELLRFTGHVLGGKVDTVVDIVRLLRSAGDELEPEERPDRLPAGGVPATLAVRDPVAAVVAVQPSDAGRAVLRRWCEEHRGGLRGWRRPWVWLEMLAEAPRARVLIGTAEVGHADVPLARWERMSVAAARHVFADGVLPVRLTGDGAVEVGWLVVSFVPEDPVYNAVAEPAQGQHRLADPD